MSLNTAHRTLHNGQATFSKFFNLPDYVRERVAL